MPRFSIRWRTTPGSSWPGRVPIGRPSSAVKPIVLSMLRPPSMRAHRGAAAEVGGDDPAAGDLRGELGQAVGDVLVAEAVEAVAADALVVEGARDGVAVGDGRAGRGGRRCRSRRPAASRARSPARGGSARGCSAGAAAPATRARQAVEDGGVDAHRAVEVGAAVDDAVADGVDLDAVEGPEPGSRRLDGRRAGRGSAAANARGRPAWRRRRRWRAAAGGRRCRRSGRGSGAAGRPSATSKSWNFRLDEPALTTRMRPCIRRGTAALARRALA